MPLDLHLLTVFFEKRKLNEDKLVPCAAVVGGPKLVDFLPDGNACVSD